MYYCKNCKISIPNDNIYCLKCNNKNIPKICYGKCNDSKCYNPYCQIMKNNDFN